jgi:hypothetical protein
MSAPTREDFEVGVTRMVEVHPDDASPQARYDAAVSALTVADFTPHELRGMLAVALDRLAKVGVA